MKLYTAHSSWESRHTGCKVIFCPRWAFFNKFLLVRTNFGNDTSFFPKMVTLRSAQYQFEKVLISIISIIIESVMRTSVYNEQSFMTAIEESFRQYKRYGARSTEKLKPIHKHVAETTGKVTSAGLTDAFSKQTANLLKGTLSLQNFYNKIKNYKYYIETK
jgi:hypothetical protein